MKTSIVTTSFVLLLAVIFQSFSYTGLSIFKQEKSNSDNTYMSKKMTNYSKQQNATLESNSVYIGHNSILNNETCSEVQGK